MTEPLRCFTAYDVRGRVPAELNETIAVRIALACALEGLVLAATAAVRTEEET